MVSLFPSDVLLAMRVIGLVVIVLFVWLLVMKPAAALDILEAVLTGCWRVLKGVVGVIRNMVRRK